MSGISLLQVGDEDRRNLEDAGRNNETIALQLLQLWEGAWPQDAG